MRCARFPYGVFLALPACAIAAPVVTDKPVARIDSLIATGKGQTLMIQAKGAVMGGGWKQPRSGR